MAESESESGKVELPSEEELAKLPRRAMIAFAGRCARRVQPLFKHFWPDAPKEHVDAIDRAISLVERSAVSPVIMSDLKSAAVAAADAANRFIVSVAAATLAAGSEATQDLRSRTAANAVSKTTQDTLRCRTAANAANAAARGTTDAAYRAVLATTNAAHAVANAAMRRDYELLRAAAEREQWTDETPVPPEFFGPLWPDGAPEGWPASPQVPAYLAHPVASEDQISQLPHKAQVAYAARCARRVLPLFLHYWPDAPDTDRRWVEKAVELAEGVASAATASHVVFPAGKKDEFLSRAMTRATARSAETAGVSDVATDAALAAEAAAAAAFALLPGIDEKWRPQLAQSAYVAGNAATNAVAAAEGRDAYASEIANEAIRRDFELLKSTATRENWKDETRVRPEIFGPLWPDGEPEGWPVSEDDNQNESPAYADDAPSLSLYFDLDEFSSEEIADFINRLSALYEEIGGDKLIIDDSCVLEFALVPEEV